MSVRVQKEDFDVASELAAMRAGQSQIGALAVFLGLVRDLNVGLEVSEMLVEHYPGMTEKALRQIVVEAGQRWEILDPLVIHRVGHLLPCDQIVLVAVASAHRGQAFAACEFIMDCLKTRATFWKWESTSAGDRWVNARESDDSAAARWAQEPSIARPDPTTPEYGSLIAATADSAMPEHKGRHGMRNTRS